MAYTQDQATQLATSQYQPTYNLGLQSLDQNALDVNQNYDTLARNLQDQAQKSNSSLLENQNKLGLLQSGLTASGLGDIQKNLNTNNTTDEQQRASRLATIALQRAGLTTKYNTDVQSTVDSLLHPKVTPVDLGNQVAFVDDRGNVVSRQAKGLTPGSGGSANAGLDPSVIAALLGASSGNQAPASGISKQDAANALATKLKAAFSQGRFVNGTEAILPQLYQDALDANGNPILTQDEINQIVFSTRKPFETSGPVSGPVNPKTSTPVPQNNTTANKSLSSAIGMNRLSALNHLLGLP